MKQSLQKLKNKYQNLDCVILGNGPSLANYYYEALTTNKITIGMNRTAGEIQTDYYCFIRGSIWEDELHDVPGALLCHGIVGTDNDRFRFYMHYTVQPTKNRSGNLLEGHETSNTGVFALYMAGWMGFDRAYLLGYDCGVEGHIGKHSKVMDRTSIAKRFNTIWGPEITKAFPKMKVYNCNMDSNITYWPFADAETCL